MGDIVRPGRRANQLAAYSQPLTAAQKKNWGRKIKPLGFEGPAGKLGSAFVAGPGSDPWKAYLKGNYAHGEERQGARQSLRQVQRDWRQSNYNTRYTDMPKNYINKQFGKFIDEQQQPPTPEMGYNPLGDYGEPQPTVYEGIELLDSRTADYKPAAAQRLLDRKKKLLQNHSQAWFDTWMAEAQPDLTGARGARNYGTYLNKLIGSTGYDSPVAEPEKIEELAHKLGAAGFQKLLRMYAKNNVYNPATTQLLTEMGYVVPEQAISVEKTPENLRKYVLDQQEKGKLGRTPGPATAAPAGEATGLTAQSATDKIKEKAALMGLPLTPEFEAQMRVYEDQLAAQLAEIGVAREQIQPMLDLALERMATQQGIDTGSLRETLVDRGIYDSGVTTRDWSRLNADYARSQQDLAMNAANQYSQLAAEEGNAYLGYQQQMIEALIQRAIDAAQNVPLGLRTDGYSGVGADAATRRRARIRDRRRDRRADRRAENA